MNACNELICQCFHIEGASQEYYKKAMWGKKELFHWAAKVDGKVVSCVTTLIDGSAASFWNGATCESFRHQGLSTALRKMALNHAISKGCHTGISYLMAEGLALGICNKLGFQTKWRFRVTCRSQLNTFFNRRKNSKAKN